MEICHGVWIQTYLSISFLIQESKSRLYRTGDPCRRTHGLFRVQSLIQCRHSLSIWEQMPRRTAPVKYQPENIFD